MTNQTNDTYTLKDHGREPADQVEARLLHREDDRVRRRRRRYGLNILTWQLALLFGLLIAWSLASGTLIDPLFFSDPWDIATAFWRILNDGTLGYHLRFTAIEFISGYVIGVAAGVIMAITVSLLPLGEPIVRPLMLATFATPKVALAPLIIIWFGIGLAPKILLAAVLVFFIVYFNTLAGIASVSPGLIDVARIMKASRFALFVKFILPTTSVFIFTAMRIAIPSALIGAIIGEFVSSNRGIGYLISAASYRYDTAQVFAGILSLLFFVILIDMAVSAAERRFIGWRDATNRVEEWQL